MKRIAVWHKPFNEEEQLSPEKLSFGEKQKAERFYQTSDRAKYIASHLFLRKVLSHYFPSVAEEMWHFEVNAYGKPFLASSHGVKFHFNLSHSRSHVYIMCSAELECGIDAEDIRTMEWKPGLLDLVMHKEEQKTFLASKEKAMLFFKYWTLKEAHIKALGKGVSIPLNSVVFDHLNLQPSHFKAGDRHYWSYSYAGDHCLAFTVEEKEEVEVDLYRENDLQRKKKKEDRQ